MDPYILSSSAKCPGTKQKKTSADIFMVCVIGCRHLFLLGKSPSIHKSIKMFSATSIILIVFINLFIFSQALMDISKT